MDIGLFAYWWTGIAGDFTARPITETGVDQPFLPLVRSWPPRLVLCCVRGSATTATERISNEAPPQTVEHVVKSGVVEGRSEAEPR
jgi:hypothetical protein